MWISMTTPIRFPSVRLRLTYAKNLGGSYWNVKIPVYTKLAPINLWSRVRISYAFLVYDLTTIRLTEDTINKLNLLDGVTVQTP